MIATVALHPVIAGGRFAALAMTGYAGGACLGALVGGMGGMRAAR